jgi:hypothetical protein
MTRLAQGVAAVPAMAATSSRTQSLHSLHTKPLGMLRSKSRRKPHPRRAGMRGFLEYVDDWIGEKRLLPWPTAAPAVAAAGGVSGTSKWARGGFRAALFLFAICDQRHSAPRHIVLDILATDPSDGARVVAILS